MGTVEIDDAEDEMEAWLERVAAGEEIVICRQGVPAARLIHLEQASSSAPGSPGNTNGMEWDAVGEGSMSQTNDIAKRS